ncbi:MAG: FAD-dependent oxidoreductase [Gammaproteobacteria bacterium]|jgi:protoporphyrinogen oxidase|nr:FAD-dependent oxidoreductase [Gammaproteobacteria bacterium]
MSRSSSPKSAFGASERGPHVTVLGAGIAGLALGYYARRSGIRATLYERERSPGGLSVTFAHDGFLFDSGAHRFHDKDAEVTRDVLGLLGDDLRPVDRPSMIFEDGRLMRFPFGLRDVLGHVGPAVLARGVLEVAAERCLARPSGRENFAVHARRRYGRTIAERFLLGYSRKLWGVPCEELSAQASGGRLNGLDVRQFVLDTLLGSGTAARHVDGRFYYPTRGIGMLADALARGCGPGAVRTGVEVRGIHHDGRRIAGVTLAGGQRVGVEELVSTLPIEVLLARLDPPPPEAVRRAASALEHRDLAVVALMLRRESMTRAATVYFPDPRVPFTRLTEPRNRSAAMSPPRHTSLVAEIPCRAGDAHWRADDRELVAAVCRPLERIGWLRVGEVVGSRVVRMRHAYPVLSLDHDRSLAAVRGYLDTLENLSLAGRNGRFEYGWMHDALRAGRDLVSSWSARAPGSRASRRIA